MYEQSPDARHRGCFLRFLSVIQRDDGYQTQQNDYDACDGAATHGLLQKQRTENTAEYRLKETEQCRHSGTHVFYALLLEGEQIVGAYKTVRDQVVFTSHRIIMVDMQGVTGTRQQLFVLPYRKVLHYGIQTAGFGAPLQASQLTVCFAAGHEAKFGFIGQKDLFQVANAISARIL